MLFPSILNIEYLLKQKQKTTYCDGVIALILMRLRESFAYVFDWDTKINEALPYIMATMTTPVFRLRCFAGVGKGTAAKGGAFIVGRTGRA